MEYSGAIGSVHVLDFGSKDLFDETQENPYLLGDDYLLTTIPFDIRNSPTSNSSSIYTESPSQSELPLNDEASSYSFRDFNKSARAISTPEVPLMMQQPQQQPYHSLPLGEAFSSAAANSSVTQSVNSMLTLNTQQPPQMKRQVSTESDASTTVSYMDLYDSEIHKLLYSFNRFGLANKNESSPSLPDNNSQQQAYQQIAQNQEAHSLSEYSSSSLWIPAPNKSSVNHVNSPPPTPMNSPSYRAPPQGRRRKKRCRKNRLHNSSRGIESSRCKMNRDMGASMAVGRGSITFAAVQNCLRGGGCISRIVKRPNAIVEARRKSMGTISSHLKRRQKTIKKKQDSKKCRLTEARNRVSNMKLGTSPMKANIKHLAFPQTWTAPMTRKLQLRGKVEDDEDLPGSPSSGKHELRRDSLIQVETLDKIGTRAACPVHLIDAKLSDYSKVLPRVNTHNKLPTPDKTLRRPSAWILGAVANTS
jgi:hypothetical protein